MDRQITARVAMTTLGLAAGLALFVLFELAEAQILSGTVLLATGALVGAFSVAVLALAGPLSILRSAMGAGAVSLVVAALLLLASRGFVAPEDVMDSPQTVLSAMVLTLVPLPFWIAAQGGGWRDYRTLFGESWNIVVRMVAAWAFVGLVWAVVFLSDSLLGMVGIRVIDAVLRYGPTPWLVTGGALGLGLAVVQELKDYVSPFLLVRLLRLLVPVVFGVSAVFLLALPVRGVSGLFGAFSFAFTLLAMAGAVATLITATVDQEDAQASQSALLVRLSRFLALMLPVMAVLAAWAVWVRVAEYGWTPERVFAAKVAFLGLGYGLLYAAAAVRAAGWMDRVRQANVVMALVLLGVSALGLTPALNAERLSAASLMARIDDGRMPLGEFDAGLLSRWGKPGAEALGVLNARAAQPGQEALAKALARADWTTEVTDRPAILADLAQLLPLQPAGATAVRDMYLAVLDDYRLRTLREDCSRDLPGGGAGCVMVVADLDPRSPGEEAVLVSLGLSGYADYIGFANDESLGPVQRNLVATNGVVPQDTQAAALIRDWQLAPPPVAPVQMYQMNLPEGGGILLVP